MTASEDLGDELVRLASADNFRDVAGAGHPTLDGGRLRRGVAYRSNELVLSDVDADVVRGLGIAAVYDLRESPEVEAHPDVPLGEATWEHLPVSGIPSEIREAMSDPAAAEEAMRGVYRRFVTEPANRASFGTLLRRAATATEPLLFHCTAGKDRTGWAAAILHHVAGLAPTAAAEEYLLTNTIASATRAKYLGMVREHLGEEHVPVFERTMVADLDYLRAGYEAADAGYGSLDGYLEKGLGLDATLRSALRARLVEG